MVYQVYAGYMVGRWKVKVPQTVIPEVGRTSIFGETVHLTSLVNTFHWAKAGGSITEDDCHSANLAVQNWITTDYAPLCSAGVAFEFLTSRSMENTIAPTDTIPLSVAGGLSGDILPYEVSYFVRFSTGLTVRRGHGGFHMFPTVEGQNAGSGVPASTYEADCVAAIVALRSALLVADFVLCVASFTHQSFLPVSGITGLGKWGTVNSRKIGHGR